MNHLKNASLYILLIASLSTASFGAVDTKNVYIVQNINSEDSIFISEYYAQVRGIPSNNILRLSLPTREEIASNKFYESVYNPVIEALFDQGAMTGEVHKEKNRNGRLLYRVDSTSIDFLVTTIGTPLKMKHSRKMKAERMGIDYSLRTSKGSIDSHLAQILSIEKDIVGPVQNPLFDIDLSIEESRNMVLKVSRLDGPNVSAVKELIDNAIYAEKNAFYGSAVVEKDGPHAAGKYWLKTAQSYLETSGITIERDCLVNTSRTVGNDAVSFYFGWYQSKPPRALRNKDFKFKKGAIGFHIHSYSGKSLVDENSWVAFLISRGVSCTVGNTYEPYLRHTHRPQIMFHALRQGKTWGEAAYQSINCIGWQGVVIGDPLYRPFTPQPAFHLLASNDRQIGY